MKKLIYGGLFLALVGIGFIGCQKEGAFESNENNATTISDSNQQKSSVSIKNVLEQNPERVGEIHNETLEFVYDQLTNLSFDVRNNMSEQELLDFTKDKSIEYLMTYTGEDISYEEISEFLSFLDDNSELEFDEAVNEYIHQFYLGEEEISLSIHTKRVNQVIDDAKLDENLNQEEINTIIAIGSVAKKSHQYWESNSNAWYSLFNLPKAPPPGYKGRIIDADIDGAGQGALTGLVGGWVGSLLGACLGGPVASAWQGVREYNS